MKAAWIALVLVACSSKKSSEPPGGSALLANQSGSAPSPSGGSKEARRVIEQVGFATPESVLHYGKADVYLVSNINGKPAEADDNGFISKLSPDGTVTELKWIDGSKPDIKLDAPKGMAISGSVLWVADITVLRRFDVDTGKQLDDVKIDGASFLNDVFPDGHEGVYVRDTGVDASFKPVGTDAVYEVDKAGKATPIVKAKDLGGPNGLAMPEVGTLVMVTFRSGELAVIKSDKELPKPIKLPKGSLDGIVVDPQTGDFYVSSWEGKTVFRGKPGGTWEDLMLDIEGPADIGWDWKRKRLLVPHFNGNAVTFLGL